MLLLVSILRTEYLCVYITDITFDFDLKHFLHGYKLCQLRNNNPRSLLFASKMLSAAENTETGSRTAHSAIHSGCRSHVTAWEVADVNKAMCSANTPAWPSAAATFLLFEITRQSPWTGT